MVRAMTDDVVVNHEPYVSLALSKGFEKRVAGERTVENRTGREKVVEPSPALFCAHRRDNELNALAFELSEDFLRFANRFAFGGIAH